MHGPSSANTARTAAGVGVTVFFKYFMAWPGARMRRHKNIQNAADLRSTGRTRLVDIEGCGGEMLRGVSFASSG
jgi:hypothetical protein